MKRSVLVLVLLFACLPALVAQQSSPNNAQSDGQSAGQASSSDAGQPGQGRRQPERWRYDPGAKKGGGDGNCSPQGLKKINPDDVNYGGLLANWRIAVVENTVYSIQFWMNVVLFCIVGTCFFYIQYLHRQREQRLTIAADIVTQLSNMYLDARDRVYEVTGLYTKMVEEETTQTERQTANEAQKGASTATDNATLAMQRLQAQAATASNTSQSSASGTPTTAERNFFIEEPEGKKPEGKSDPDPSQPLTPDPLIEEDDHNKGEPLSVKAKRFAERKYDQPAPAQPTSVTDRKPNNAPEQFSWERQATQSETKPPVTSGAQPVTTVAPRTSGTDAEKSVSDEEIRAELERVRRQLAAREQQIGNQRLVINQLVDENKTLKAPPTETPQGQQ